MSAPGIALAVVAGGSYAVYTLAAKRLLTAGHAPEAVMAVAFGLAAVVLLPALALSEPGWLLHADGIALALFLGVIPTALAYVLFARGLKRLSASETATLTLAEPLTAGVLGAVVLAEPMTAMSAAGAGLVLAGLLALGVRLPAPAVASPSGPRHDQSMAATRPLHRPSTVDALADALRREILDGELPAGSRLRERELCETYGVARHSLRAALRALATQGLVRIEQHRGATRRPAQRRRRALAVRAARGARARGRPPRARAQRRTAAGQRPRGAGPPGGGVRGRHVEHDQRGPRRPARGDRGRRPQPAHHALPTRRSMERCSSSCSRSGRTSRAERLAADHVALVRGLERDGPPVLREHLRVAAETLVDA